MRISEFQAERVVELTRLIQVEGHFDFRIAGWQKLFTSVHES